MILQQYYTLLQLTGWCPPTFYTLFASGDNDGHSDSVVLKRVKMLVMMVDFSQELYP